MDEREPHYQGVSPEALPETERSGVHVVLDNIRSAFNVGSIFRTSDAGSVAHIHLCGMTAAPPNPRLLRTSLGAHDYVPWNHEEDTLDAIKALKARGVPVVAIETVPDAPTIYDFEWPETVALVLGHETRGIRDDVLAECDAAVVIPMRGHKNTINVATAYGVVLFEILRQQKAFESE